MPSKIPKVFIDTNVWFSVFFGSTNCNKIIQSHIVGRIKAVVSQKVISELVRNIEKKLPHAMPRMQNLFLNTPPKIVSDPTIIDKRFIKLISIKDQKIFQSAVSYKVDLFITGNIKDFKVEKLTGIKIITPNQAVRIFKL